jgi:3-deoxy-D-manno-octulosonic-acid transferase
MSKPTASYRLLARLISPLWLFYTIFRSIKDGGKIYLKERFGFYNTDTTKRIWIHAASVGEINTVLPLVKKIGTTNPDRSFVITTNTPTGKRTLLGQLPENCIHRYLPIDMPGACNRFLVRHQITHGWVVETEIWPWLYNSCHSAALPITIINGRITDKTLNTGGLLAKAYVQCLQGVTVLAKDDNEAQRFRLLSNNGARVLIGGNLKFSSRSRNHYSTPLLEGAYCVAASTHHNEEEQLAQAWLDINPPCTLVIVPRHPERGPSIQKNLKSLACVPLRSQNQSINSAPLYIADTLGELDHWYAFATAVFIGGSLIDRGGQNIFEAVRHEKLVVTGPSMFNFQEEITLLENVDAVIRADTAENVAATLKRATVEPAWANQIGAKAQNVANSQSNVCQDYVNLLLPRDVS